MKIETNDIKTLNDKKGIIITIPYSDYINGIFKMNDDIVTEDFVELLKFIELLIKKDISVVNVFLYNIDVVKAKVNRPRISSIIKALVDNIENAYNDHNIIPIVNVRYVAGKNHVKMTVFRLNSFIDSRRTAVKLDFRKKDIGLTDDIEKYAVAKMKDFACCVIIPEDVYDNLDDDILNENPYDKCLYDVQCNSYINPDNVFRLIMPMG